jgi:hypothetical protein
MVSLRQILLTANLALKYGSTKARYFLLEEIRKESDNYVNA